MTEAVLIAFALAMDSFAVALTQGARFRPGWRQAARIALIFGAFHVVMPLVGYAIGAVGLAYLEAIDHWIAFGLLGFLGGRMLTGHAGGEEASARPLRGRTLILAAFATSIDVLAAGITLPTLGIALPLAIALIGGVTFAMSLAGVWLGRMAGDAFGPWAERAGGVILIALGVKILAEHTGWL